MDNVTTPSNDDLFALLNEPGREKNIWPPIVKNFANSSDNALVLNNHPKVVGRNFKSVRSSLTAAIKANHLDDKVMAVYREKDGLEVIGLKRK